jgi:hypothetical protein
MKKLIRLMILRAANFIENAMVHNALDYVPGGA